MKKTTLIAAFIAFAAAVSAQNVSPYDSLSNFLGTEVARYVGQVLYVVDNNEARANNGYAGFALEPNFNLGANGRNVYKSVASKVPLQNVSAYDQVAGHYFYVRDVVAHPSQTFTGRSISHFLLLEDAQTGDKCYATYAADKEADFDKFIVMGYYDKMRQTLVGRKFIFTGKEPVYRSAAYQGLQDMGGRGKRTDVKVGSELTCVDVAIEQANNYRMIAVLDSPVYGSVYTMATDLRNTGAANAKFTTTSDIDNLALQAQQAKDQQTAAAAARLADAVSRFGTENGTLLAAGEVRNGMTAEMCRWAFGTPWQIGTIVDNGATVERWSYTDGRDIFLKDNVVIRHVKTEGYKSPVDTPEYLKHSSAQ